MIFSDYSEDKRQPFDYGMFVPSILSSFIRVFYHTTCHMCQTIRPVIVTEILIYNVIKLTTKNVINRK